MRKEAKQHNNIRVATAQGYHNGEWATENYAFSGFEKNQYYTSDRTIKLDEHFKPLDNKTTLKGYGLEIEIECFGGVKNSVLVEVLNKVVFDLFPKYLFKCQNDGSLRSGSSQVECITQVMTKSFIRNNYKNFKTMFDTYFQAFEISATRSGNCGMHCNISNAVFGATEAKQAEAIRKLYYIINKYYKFMCKLLNRNLDNNGYCRQMPLNSRAFPNEVDYCKNLSLEGWGSDHYVCFNLGHYESGRIELRLVGGQKNFACFRNTMESIFQLIEAVKTLSWNNLTLVNIFKGCNKYVADRIESMCYEHISYEDIQTIKANINDEELI